jgi:acyl carrier protein
MTDVRTKVCNALALVAPEADLETLEPDSDLQESLDLDSMDFLNFMIGVKKATGVDVPERDYPQVSTLRGCVDYVEAHSVVS